MPISTPQKNPCNSAAYAELHCISNFSFLRGASHPEELVIRANELGYSAIAITDECSLAGVVRAHMAAKDLPIRLIIGSEFVLDDGCHFVLLAQDRKSYGELSHLISCARREAKKGDYVLTREMLGQHLPANCLALWIPPEQEQKKQEQQEQKEQKEQKEQQEPPEQQPQLEYLRSLFAGRLWIATELLLRGDDNCKLHSLQQLGKRYAVPLCAAGGVYMHLMNRRAIQDTLTAIRLIKPITELGYDAEPNGQRHLRSIEQLGKLYPVELMQETLAIADRCDFDLAMLRYEYPSELVPADSTPARWLRQLTEEGVNRRWPEGVSDEVRSTIERELTLIREMDYEHYFLTVHDVVSFARSQHILCQGRGSAANSVVCYCLGITEVSPEQTQLLFERFVSKERNEPPDIDVDFENARREEVIQYIYEKYGRHRAAIAATVITYRSRSAIRDVGKALGLESELIDHLAKSVFWWGTDLEQQLSDANVDFTDTDIQKLMYLARSVTGFPRHLSQHVGGFIISRGPLTRLVPVENAAMADRSIIQWDKDDLESLGLMKVDVLALGMLTALRKSVDLVNSYSAKQITIQSIPKEDSRVYDMICKADTVGVFQIESRAQMSMLPRLRPRSYYDLVIQIAIVRPGPIEGGMVHPYLRRRNGEETPTFESKDMEKVLGRTLGVPIFQEQVMQIAMVGAGFTGGEADQLRRAMAAWKKKGGLEPFKNQLVKGMTSRGYSEQFAMRIYKQIKGFGEYGFPESHSASFALLAYVSSWFKYYHPAAFCCALLNSQPMGFYPPAQLVQDARRHGVEVLAIDINQSQWHATLEFAQKNTRPSLRLGFAMAKGLSANGAEAICQARGERHFSSVQELVSRSGISKGDMESLAAADALRSISGDRYRAFWQAAGSEACPDTNRSNAQLNFYSDSDMAKDNFGADVMLPVPSEGMNILADYSTTSLTLRRHPMALLRKHLDQYSATTAKGLMAMSNNNFAKVAGIVTSRQRPQTASGVTFITLEDESGFINVVVWPKLGERQRQTLRQASLMGVLGRVQISEGIIHLIANELVDLSSWLGGLSMKSRNFC